MIAELNQRLSGIEDALRGVAQAVGGLNERVCLLSEQQTRLLELLTPEQKPKKDDLGLDELLAAMVVRLDTQNHLLKDVSDVVSKSVTELPLSVVQAIMDAFPASESETPRPNGIADGRGGVV
jgi:hypothetical protein